MLTLDRMLTGTYSDCCREAFKRLQPTKVGGVLPIDIIEMQSDEVWWLQIKFKLADLAGLSESDQYKWAGYIKDLQLALIKCNKLVEVYRID